MSNETIPLAKGNNPAKRKYPGFLSLKLDGVPIRVDVELYENSTLTYSIRTRQGEQVLSCVRQVENFIDAMQHSPVRPTSGTHTFVFEVTHKHLKDFKDVSGVVRRQAQQEDLVLNLFDYYGGTDERWTFQNRLFATTQLFAYIGGEDFNLIDQFYVADELDFECVKGQLLAENPEAEGLIYRAADGQWAPGKRRWDYQKILNEPTVDLQIVGFEEAKCGKTGAGKGMVGRLVAEYKGTQIGVGPGKLTHKERKSLWSSYQSAMASSYAQEALKPLLRIATIKYKRDPSYTALRQPTFQHWRPEKTEPSYE